MTVQQLDLFETHDIEQAKEVKSGIYSRLKHYEVDDYYERNIKGRSMLLSEVRERLSDLPKYYEYLELLIKELSAVVLTVPRDEEERYGYSHLIQVGNDYRYYCRYINRGSRVACEGTVFCLKMIDDDFFIN